VRLALIIEYDGARYSGFQFQVNAPSIQAELELAVRRLTGETVRVAGAGRTDAGVHASGQVVAFGTASKLGAERFVAGMNFHLPRDVAVRRASEVAESFDPRRAAVSRRYRYTLLRRASRSPLSERSAAVVPVSLDIETMRKAAKLMVGTHDFSRFAGQLARPDASTVRAVSRVDIDIEGERIEIQVEGNAFLPHQVRRMVGALVDVGRGRMTAEQVGGLLNGTEKRAVAHSMPPQGLNLVEVRYPEELGLNKTIG
jgi:tRNA pseudouridine38-40 synthase